MRKPTTLLLVILAGLSCSKDSTGPKEPPPPQAMIVLPDSATVDVFDTLALRAVALDASGDTVHPSVTWMSAAPNTVFVSGSGRVEGLTRGTVTVTASAGSVSGHARIKVKIPVIQVHLRSPGTLEVGDTARIADSLLTPDGLPPDDSVLTWTTSDTTKAVISSNGVVSARAQGTVIINGRVDTATGLTEVIIPEPVAAVVMSPHADTMRLFADAQVTTIQKGPTGDTLPFPRVLTWTTSDSSVIQILGGTPTVTIRALGEGRAVVRARYRSLVDSCVVIVAHPTVDTVSITPDSGRAILPASFALNATLHDSVGFVLTGRSITWKVTDTTLATVAPDTGANVVVTGRGPGAAHVVGASEARADTVVFQFLRPSVATITLSPDTGSFIIPDQPYFTIAATVLDSVGDPLVDRVVSWKITDTSVAQASTPTGAFINLLGRKAGMAVVVATTEGHVDTARILVVHPTVRHIALSPDTSSIVVPATVDIGGVVEDSLGQQLVGRSIHWTSADTSIAAVSDTIGNQVTVTGKIGGTARIVATCEGVSDTAFVHIVRPSVAKVVLLSLSNGPADTSRLLLTTQRTFAAEALDSNNAPLNRPFTFVSSDSAVLLPAFQFQSGFESILTVTGAAQGTTVFSASSEGKSVTWNASVYSVGYDTVAAGNGESCMPATDGLVYCWGENPNSPFPTPVAATTGIHSVSAKVSFACGLDVGGNAYCWGSSRGPLGTSGTQTYDTARAVLGGLSFTQIDAGYDDICGVTAGSIACWGNNDHAQLGTGDSSVRSQPTAVAANATFASISAGYQHTCAVSTIGTLYCWGANESGQSGQVGGGDVGVPRAVDSTAQTFAVVSAGYDHTCALTTTGTAYCWGGNSAGQLGTGDQVSRSAPTAVSGGLTFKSIAAGEYATCGVTTAGAAYCWGTDASLALGNSTLTTMSSSLVPLAVSGGLTFTSISAGIAGNGNVCGMTTGGAYCWGLGAAGGPAKAPVRIPGQP